MIEALVKAYVRLKERMKEHAETGKSLREEEKTLRQDILSYMEETDECVIRIADNLYVCREPKSRVKRGATRDAKEAVRRAAVDEGLSANAVDKIMAAGSAEKVQVMTVNIKKTAPIS